MLRRHLFSIALFGFGMLHLAMFSQSKTNDVIMKALVDELERNITNLKNENGDSAFFISYMLSDIQTLKVNATLGAIVSSTINEKKDKGVRVMVGNYEVNDENFSDYNPEYENRLTAPALPLDNDYIGIRRSFWVETDDIFNLASSKYNNKIKALEENKLASSDLQISDFSKEPVIELYQEFPEFVFDKPGFESLARQVSMKFKDYPEIINSNVTYTILFAKTYFANSEGTRIQMPVSLATVNIYASAYTHENEIISDNISYLAKSPAGLPNLDTLSKDVDLLVKNLVDLKNAEVFDDYYTGPVLLIGQPVADLISDQLFKRGNSLIAVRENLTNDRQSKLFYQDANHSLESRIGRKIISNNITVKDISRLEQYNGIELIGSYHIDGEGVVPPEELVLVEKGILKTLLNGRTPTRKIQQSNGHKRIAVSPGGFSRQIAPGVIQITSENKLSIAELKKELLVQARDEGYDYAFVIKPIKVGDYNNPVNIYKIDAASGEETLMQSVYIKDIPENALKESVVFSDQTMVCNKYFTDNYFNRYSSNSAYAFIGLPVSFITPNAALVKNVEIASKNKPLSENPPLVGSPLGEQ